MQPLAPLTEQELSEIISYLPAENLFSLKKTCISFFNYMKNQHPVTNFANKQLLSLALPAGWSHYGGSNVEISPDNSVVAAILGNEKELSLGLYDIKAKTWQICSLNVTSCYGELCFSPDGKYLLMSRVEDFSLSGRHDPDISIHYIELWSVGKKLKVNEYIPYGPIYEASFHFITNTHFWTKTASSLDCYRIEAASNKIMIQGTDIDRSVCIPALSRAAFLSINYNKTTSISLKNFIIDPQGKPKIVLDRSISRPEKIWVACLSADKQQIAIAVPKGSASIIYILDSKTEVELKNITVDQLAIKEMAFINKDSLLLRSGYYPQQLGVVDLATGKYLRLWTGDYIRLISSPQQTKILICKLDEKTQEERIDVIKVTPPTLTLSNTSEKPAPRKRRNSI